MGYKTKSLKRQVQEELVSKARFGESKYQAKKDGTSSDGIYSNQTLKNYMDRSIKFTDFCKENYGCKTLAECKQHVGDYINHQRERGLSAHTQKLDVAALGKLYGQSFSSQVQTDTRHRADITRSRLDTARGRHFSEERNQSLVDFCKSTGLRRSELESLKGKDLIEKDGKYYIVVESGKGGKYREAEVIGNVQNVLDKFNGVDSDEKVWGRVHNACDVHSYRADYAQELYNQYARDLDQLEYGEKYYCRGELTGTVYDREAMQIVSENLGHNRIDVIASNYLYKK